MAKLKKRHCRHCLRGKSFMNMYRISYGSNRTICYRKGFTYLLPWVSFTGIEKCNTRQIKGRNANYFTTRIHWNCTYKVHARQSNYWPEVWKDISLLVGNYETCEKLVKLVKFYHNAQHAEPALSHFVPVHLWV